MRANIQPRPWLGAPLWRASRLEHFCPRTAGLLPAVPSARSTHAIHVNGLITCACDANGFFCNPHVLVPVHSVFNEASPRAPPVIPRPGSCRLLLCLPAYSRAPTPQPGADRLLPAWQSADASVQQGSIKETRHSQHGSKHEAGGPRRAHIARLVSLPRASAHVAAALDC